MPLAVISPEERLVLKLLKTCQLNPGLIPRHDISVRTETDLGTSFEVKVGIFQDSALSHILFSLYLQYATTEIQKPTPYMILCADDIVLIVESATEL